MRCVAFSWCGASLAPQDEKKEHGQTRQAKCYWVDATFKPPTEASDGRASLKRSASTEKPVRHAAAHVSPDAPNGAGEAAAQTAGLTAAAVVAAAAAGSVGGGVGSGVPPS